MNDDDRGGSAVAGAGAIAGGAAAVIADGRSAGREARDGDEQRQENGLELHVQVLGRGVLVLGGSARGVTDFCASNTGRSISTH